MPWSCTYLYQRIITYRCIDLCTYLSKSMWKASPLTPRSPSLPQALDGEAPPPLPPAHPPAILLTPRASEMAWEIVREIPGDSWEISAPRPGLRGLSGHYLYLPPPRKSFQILQEYWINYNICNRFLFWVAMDLYVSVN